MSGRVEYVEVYPDGHEVVHHDSPLTKELSRIGADDELTYEQQYEDGVCDGLTPLAIVIDGYSGATEYLHLKSELKPKAAYEDPFKASATYRLTRIVHHVEYPDPPTTGPKRPMRTLLRPALLTDSRESCTMSSIPTRQQRACGLTVRTTWSGSTIRTSITRS